MNECCLLFVHSSGDLDRQTDEEKETEVENEETATIESVEFEKLQFHSTASSVPQCEINTKCKTH